MSIRLISISHKTAPLEVRELFAFTKEKQAELEKILIDEGGAAGERHYRYLQPDRDLYLF